MLKTMKSISAIISVIVISLQTFCQVTYLPAENWMKFKNFEDAGFTTSEIENIKDQYIKSGSSALMIIYDGAVVLSLGEISRRHLDQSMRKSYLSALFGIFKEKGLIDIQETLSSLGIDDILKLTDEEKEAAIVDLLTSKSGVYHPSAYSPKNMIRNLPPRGSHKHGTFWFYNNWDFNTLGAIFEMKTNLNVFSAFNDYIAKPIEMEDFSLSSTYFRFEKELSDFPAYLFRLSARDEARFGLLYLNNGKWGNTQIIPTSWVKESTSKQSDLSEDYAERCGYGYLWWCSVNEKNEPFYFANGANGQRIIVVPAKKMVVVNSTNSYDPSKNIPDIKIDNLIKIIMRSQTGRISDDAELEPLITETGNYPDHKVNSEFTGLYSGEYDNKMLGKMTVEYKNNSFLLKTTIGEFILHPKSDFEFIAEDMEYTIIFTLSSNEYDKRTVSPAFDDNNKIKNLVFYY